MHGRGATLAVVSAKYPYGPRESYLGVELEGLARHYDRILVAPVSPDRAQPPRSGAAEVIDLALTGGRTAFAALREVLRAPVRALTVVAHVLIDPKTSLRTTLKNAAVLPYAFALTRRLREAGVDHVHGYWLSTPATVAYVVAFMNGITFSATAHRWDIYEGNLTARKASLATAIRAISHRGARDLRDRVRPRDRSKIRVVRVGVALDRRMAPVRARSGALDVVCAANLVDVKGHRDLIDAVALARAAGADVRATFAGDGPLRDELVARAAARGVSEAIAFAGSVPHEQLLDALAHGSFDAAVLASVERPGGEMEGVPVALIEAMGLGVPVVGTTSGSIPELLDGAGIVVPHSQPPALADALVALAADPARRASLAARGRARVAAMFDRDATALRLAVLLGRKSQTLTPYEAISPGTLQAPAIG